MREISPIGYDNTRYYTNSGYAAMTWCQKQILTCSPLFCCNKWLTSSTNYFSILLLQLHKLPYRWSKDCIFVLPDLMFYHLIPFDESKMLLTSLLKVSTFLQDKADSQISADLELLHLHHLWSAAQDNICQYEQNDSVRVEYMTFVPEKCPPYNF